jgi:hypothetical protein
MRVFDSFPRENLRVNRGFDSIRVTIKFFSIFTPAQKGAIPFWNIARCLAVALSYPNRGRRLGSVRLEYPAKAVVDSFFSFPRMHSVKLLDSNEIRNNRLDATCPPFAFPCGLMDSGESNLCLP